MKFWLELNIETMVLEVTVSNKKLSKYFRLNHTIMVPWDLQLMHKIILLFIIQPELQSLSHNLTNNAWLMAFTFRQPIMLFILYNAVSTWLSIASTCIKTLLLILLSVGGKGAGKKRKGAVYMLRKHGG